MTLIVPILVTLNTVIVSLILANLLYQANKNEQLYNTYSSRLEDDAPVTHILFVYRDFVKRVNLSIKVIFIFSTSICLVILAVYF
jgi:hypothetical protein